MSAHTVYRATAAHWADWWRMSCALFPDEPREELERGMREFAAEADAAVFIAARPDGSACGFVEAGTRKYADGCLTSPVGYVEAWYVDPDTRTRGVGRALLTAAEQWARDRGYTEMASDALITNTLSHRAHGHCGYEEVERLVVFRKPL